MRPPRRPADNPEARACGRITAGTGGRHDCPFLADRIDLIASRFVANATERAPAGAKAYFRQLYYELAISTSPHAVASGLQLADPERILFGTDFPALFEEEVQGLTQALEDNPLLRPSDLEMIKRHNALRLFPRLRHPSPAVR